MSARAAVVVLFAIVVSHSATVAATETDRGCIQSLGVRVAYGIGDRSNLKFATLLPRVTFFFPDLVHRPLARYGVHAEFVVEPIISYISNSTDAVEFGVNPLVFSLRYDQGQRLVPFLEAGEGVLYNGIRDEGLGTRFQFSSQGGGGLHWFLDRTTALTFSYRIRHISNASITSQNRGLNTHFFAIGLTFFPKR